MDAHEITRRRTDLGLSRLALARETGVDAATVWRWETGATQPSGLALRQLHATFQRLEKNRARRLARRAATGTPLR
jgi:DNA-binding transcriptional regulator YiaG